ncbi:MAG: hypothetical protein VXW58_16580 [Pseudomonadota bacterium]|nr:hypothetical protein [Pseudomonadota bacterium]
MSRWRVGWLALACGLWLTGPLAAQTRVPLHAEALETLPDLSGLSDAELLDLLGRLERQRRPSGPVSIFGIPSGFGVPHGVGFAALAATNRRDRGRTGDWDASFVLGAGFGDAERGVNVTPILDVTSVSPHHFGESGKFGLRLARALPYSGQWRMSAAVDLDNLLTWGDSRVLSREWSVAVSGIRAPDDAFGAPVMVSLGYGSGVAARGTDSGAFAGVGVGVSRYASVSLGWFGDEAIAGGSFLVPGRENLQISLGVGDITNRVSGRRVLVALSFSRQLRRN